MIKPKAVEMYPVYICDDCSSRHCETLEYVNKIGKILCGCGKVLTLTPIETFKVAPVFKTVARKLTHNTDKLPEEILENDFAVVKHTSEICEPPPVDKGSKSKHIIEQNQYDKAVDLLVSLGYKKTESKKKVDESVSSWLKSGKLTPVDDSNF